jgi:aryl-alcohol dehydrogenase-like predicted oxidoreductase
MLLEALDRGINFYDTADIYAQGRSERLLGKAFKHQRTAVIIATKAGYHLTAAGGFGARLKPILRPLVSRVPWVRKSVQRARGAQKRQDFSPAYLKKAIDQSLERLQTDYLDIFQLHSPPSSTIEAGEFIETLENAKAQGKIRWYGVSCRTVEDALLCLRYPGISSLQVAVNLLEFEGIPSLLASAKEKNVAVIARQPLASGFLARHPSLLRPEHFAVDEQEFREKLGKAKAYQFLDTGSRRTMAQAALQFVLQLCGVSVVIAGMSSRTHLNENLAAAACPLTEDERAQIDLVLGRESPKVQEKA